MFKVTNQIGGKWKTKRIMWQILQLLSPKLLLPPLPPPKKMDEFNFRPAQYCIKKIFEIFGWFQNGCNKVVIEPRVVQFWSEIIRMISKQTHAMRLFDFEITRMISALINKGQNYWALIGWERGHFFLIEGIFSNQERAWLPVNDWLIRCIATVRYLEILIFLRINFALYW